MANAQLIRPNVFPCMTEEQVLTWRTATYGNLRDRTTYSKTDMLSMVPTTVLSMDQIRESIRKRMVMYQSTGHLPAHQESVFVMIDSCVLGVQALPTIITRLKKDHGLQRNNLVLVVSQINMTENNYKMLHQTNYPCINFNRLSYNLDLLNGKTKFRMKNIVILKTDLVFDNKVLFQEECKFLQANKQWSGSDRNEINDNAQLEMLLRLKDMFSKECFMVSRDKGLLKKVRETSQSIEGLYAYHF
jgi:hypothetical protein